MSSPLDFVLKASAMTIQISESQIIELDTDGVGGYKLVSATDPSVWSDAFPVPGAVEVDHDAGRQVLIEVEDPHDAVTQDRVHKAFVERWHR